MNSSPSNPAPWKKYLPLLLVAAGGSLLLIILLPGSFEQLESDQEYELPPLSLAEGVPRQIRTLASPDEPQPEVTPVLTPTPQAVELPPSDQNLLEAITAFWMYRGYAGLGNDRQGIFIDKRHNEPFRMALGDERERVTAQELHSATAVLGLGTATVTLTLISDAALDAAGEIAESLEQVQAQLTVYWESHGKRHAYLGREYEKEIGTRMPEMLDPAATEDQVKRYMDTHYKNFMEASRNHVPRPGEIMPVPHRDDLDRQMAIDAYMRRIAPLYLQPTPDPPPSIAD